MISADDEASSAQRSSPQLRELPFASCYVYSPSDTRAASRLLRTSVKTGCVTMLIDQALEVDAGSRRSLACFFPTAAIFIPVPGSTPCAWGGATASGRLAVELWKRGLGRGVWFGLRRVRAVRKSATAAPGSRPTLQAHVDTLGVDSIRLPAASHLVLIDDVVTKGRTLLAAAVRLREAFPHADIRGFALLRTMGYAQAFDRLLMPCTGKIERTCNDARRNP